MCTSKRRARADTSIGTGVTSRTAFTVEGGTAPIVVGGTTLQGITLISVTGTYVVGTLGVFTLAVVTAVDFDVAGAGKGEVTTGVFSADCGGGTAQVFIF